ncbi:MAG: hypothetical protein ACD_69C00241G0003, partial [uncultured bacterium]
NPEITVCAFQPYQNTEQSGNNNQLKENLEKIVSQYNLKKTLCNWVLHPDYYRITLINIPNVPQSEYKKAVRWQIKDIVDYPLEDVAVDIFYPDELEKVLKKIYVVVAKASFLQNIVNTIQDCDLYPMAVDVREFAIRNLISNLATQNETVGLLNIVDESCLMVLVKQNNIRFVRRIPVGLKNIKNNDYNELIAELQRSFNYCQTELKQEAPVKLFMAPKIDIDLNKNMAQNIGKSLNKEISILDLQKIMSFKTTITQQIESSCWIAAGGALRKA